VCQRADIKGKWARGQSLPTTKRANKGKAPLQVARGAPALAPAPAKVSSVSTGVQVQIQQLQRDVNAEDLEEIFSTCGRVKKATVFYDEHGASIGNAIIVFSKSQDAQTAVLKFHGTKVDGKPMILSLLETKSVDQLTTRPARQQQQQPQKQQQQKQRNNGAPKRNGNRQQQQQQQQQKGRGKKKASAGNPLMR